MGLVQSICSFDDTRIVAEIEGHGPPLVLLHGIAENRFCWNPLVDRLCGYFQVIRLDFRGHGQSQPVDKASLDDLVGDAVAVIGAIGLEKPALLGHSLGGIVAMWIAAHHGARRLVCVDQRFSVRSFQSILKPLEKRLRGNDFADALVEEGEALGLRRVPGQHFDHLVSLRRQASQTLVLSLWSRLFTESSESIDRERSGIIGKVEAPFLAIHGEELAEEYITWLKTLLPEAELECWPDAGHWPHLVEPERFLDRVVSFLLESPA